MRIGIIITIKDRYELTKQCFESVANSILIYQNIFFVLVNDGSADERINTLISETNFNNCEKIIIQNKESIGIANSLLVGFEKAVINKADILVNLDNDTLVKPNWLLELICVYSSLKKQFGSVVTGFNTLTKDPATNKERHPIVEDFTYHYEKKSIGGINMLFNIPTYDKYIKKNLQLKGHWDWNVCKSGARFYCTKPSVIQHTGINKGTNLNNPDIAHDF